MALGKSCFDRCLYLVLRDAGANIFEIVPPRKVVGTFLLVLGSSFLNIFLLFAFVMCVNRAVTCKPPLWFQCQFSCSSSTYC